MVESEKPVPGLLCVELESETPLYQQIILGIRRQIADGLLRPGAALPSVRQLAADLEINPNTVSKSYLLLERDGILVSHKRKGYYVADAAPDRARAGDRDRLDEAMTGFLETARELGLTGDDLMNALAARVAGYTDPDQDGGR